MLALAPLAVEEGLAGAAEAAALGAAAAAGLASPLADAFGGAVPPPDAFGFADALLAPVALLLTGDAELAFGLEPFVAFWEAGSVD